MKRLFFGSPLAVVVVLGTLLLSLPNAAIASPPDKKILGEVRSDAALVYVCSYPADYLRGKWRIYCDDHLVAVLPKNTYTFTYVPPGTHLFWSDYNLLLGLCDFAAGQTYYLHIVSLSPFHPLAILSDADGQARISKASRYVALTEEDRAKAESTITKKWPKYKEKEGDKLTMAGGDIVYTPPAATDNMVRVPAGTAVVAELMENLDSGINKAGDAVWLRIAQDVKIDGSLFVRTGTPIRALIRDTRKRSRGGSGGQVDLTMVSVMAADGTVCPLVGQVATIAKDRYQLLLQVVGAVALGPAIVLGQFVKGEESFFLAGGGVKVFTRQDIWIKPLPATSGESSVARNPDHVVKAYAPDKIVCDFRKGEIPQVVQIIFEGSGDIANAELVEVAGRQIPTPIRASNLSRVKEGWIGQFGGWDLCRFLRAGNAGTQIAFLLTAVDGTVVIAQGVVPMTLQ